MPEAADSKNAPEAPAGATRQGRSPSLVLIAAWLVPGAGHLLLGRAFRAAAYFAIIVTLFSFGISLEGRLDRPDRKAPLSYLKTAADLGVGPLYFAFVLPSRGANFDTRPVPAGVGNPRSATYEHGTTFLLTAGILGWLLVLDGWDVAIGRKR